MMTKLRRKYLLETSECAACGKTMYNPFVHSPEHLATCMGCDKKIYTGYVITKPKGD